MPPTNDPKHHHAKKASPTRRKSKPKFEVPAETVAPETATAWVYRAEEVPAPPPPAVKPAPVPAETSKSHPFLVAGMGIFFIGVGTIGLMSLAAMGLMIAPMRMTKNLFSSN
jgi:hypothetical protein